MTYNNGPYYVFSTRDKVTKATAKRINSRIKEVDKSAEFVGPLRLVGSSDPTTAPTTTVSAAKAISRWQRSHAKNLTSGSDFRFCAAFAQCSAHVGLCLFLTSEN